MSLDCSECKGKFFHEIWCSKNPNKLSKPLSNPLSDLFGDKVNNPFKPPKFPEIKPFSFDNDKDDILNLLPDDEEREHATLKAIENGLPIIRGARFRISQIVSGIKVDIIGDPDFLERRNGGYVFRKQSLLLLKV